MSRPLRLLIVEDNPDDAELMVNSLQRNGLEPTWKRVETAAELESALAAERWDAVLSDYTLPEFGAAAAIEIVHAADPNMPVLVVSGTMGEEKAVETMRAGANDYVLKDNLVRLGPALDRELRAAENRQAKRAAEKLAIHLAAIVESSSDAIVSQTTDDHITSWNRGAERLYGWTPAETIGRHINFLVPPDKFAERTAIMDRVRAGERVGAFETVRLHRDGQRIDISLTMSPMCDANGRLVGVSKTGHDIRERKRADKALRASETRYRRLFEAAQDGVLIVDAASRQILDANPFLANILGYSREDLVGKELWEIGLFQDIEANKAAFRRLQEVGYVRYDDHPLLTKDGRQIDVEFVSNSYDLDGVRKIQCNIRNITEQKRAVHALLLSEARYRTLVEATAAIVWDCPASGQFDTEQAGWTAFTGQTVEQHKGWGWLDAIHPDDREKSAQTWVAAVRDHAIYQLEHRVRREDGEYRQMSARAVPIFETGGAIREWVGVHTDVTDQKLAEFERDELLARFQLYMERMPLACILFNADFRITDWNPAAARILGYSKADALGMGPLDLCPVSFWPEATELLDRIRALDMTSHSINENLTKDGRTITCEWFNTPLTSESGQFIGMLSLAQNITARREAEAALRQTEEQFRSAQHRLHHVLASSPAILFTVALSGRQAPGINWISDNLRELLGYPAETALGQEWWQKNTHPDDRDVVAEKFAADLQRKERGTYEFRFRHADGSYRWIRSELRMILDGTRQATEVVGSWSDITDRKQLEDQFNQAQKMEAFGQLAGGVAHDFNNLLTIINGYGDIVMRALAPGDKLRGFVKEIIKAGERSAALTAQLLAFSRKQVVVLKVLDLNTIVFDTEKMLRRIIGEDIELVTSLAEDTGAVRADSGQLEQVLLNLAVNARDAMPQGGKLTIETKNVELGNGYANHHLNARPGSYVLLAASDTGCGMTDEVKKRIFEPFFTTKGVGEGTGLGLATVFGIISQADGHVEVYSEVNFGTSFKIYLPRVNKAGKLRSDSVHLDAIPRGTESILLVEDEVGLRGLLHQVLNDCGYSVSMAVSGIKALQLAQEHTGTFDLIVTDVVMPGMSGRQMVEQLVARYPKVKVIYMSGYTDDAVVRHGILHDQVPYLQKPFLPVALARKVREVLDS